MALSSISSRPLMVKHTWLPTHCGGSRASRCLGFYLGTATSPLLPRWINTGLAQAQLWESGAYQIDGARLWTPDLLGTG